uniref:Putative ribbon-helix-helix protein repressor n=1 Tax=viral metagenome TaxID=1070528 RepID=A0A6M3K9Y6_9ZZZZ
MSTKVITVSLPEAVEWKLAELGKQTSIPRSVLVRKALLLLFSDFTEMVTAHGEASFGHDYTLEEVEEEYYSRGMTNDKTT